MSFDAMRRRLLRAAGAGLALPRTARGAAAPPRAAALRAPEPMGRLHVADNALLAVSSRGTLWSLDAPRATWTRVAEGLDAGSPLASGHGRIAARTAEGHLFVRESGRATVSRKALLARHGGLLVLPFGIVGIAEDGSGAWPIRLEPDAGGRWRETARGTDAVLPDARPLQVDLDPASAAGDGHVVVLGGPDGTRYQHAVLGDALEATRVLYLERHELRPLRTLEVAEPHVIEDVAPRPVSWNGRNALLTMRAGPLGAQLALVAADPRSPERLAFAALGAPIGTRHRWMAATTDGRRMLAVHTPHLGGVLNEYRVDGHALLSRVVATGVSTHAIGSRETDLAIWQDGRVALPSQSRSELRVLDPAADFAERDAVALPAPIAATAAWNPGGPGGVVALLEDGSVWHVAYGAAR